MKEIKKLNIEVAIYTLVAGLICQVLSLAFLGLDLAFGMGLWTGVLVTIINFLLLTYGAILTIERERPALGVFGFLFRMIIYAVIFALCVRYNTTMGIGAAIGFVTQKFALVYVGAVKKHK